MDAFRNGSGRVGSDWILSGCQSFQMCVGNVSFESLRVNMLSQESEVRSVFQTVGGDIRSAYYP